MSAEDRPMVPEPTLYPCLCASFLGSFPYVYFLRWDFQIELYWPWPTYLLSQSSEGLQVNVIRPGSMVCLQISLYSVTTTVVFPT